MKKTSAMLLQLFLLFLISGCAENQVLVKYIAGIGNMKYDEVLADMAPAWGKPKTIGVSNVREVIQVTYGELHEAPVGETVYYRGNLFANATSETQYGNVIQWGERYDFQFDKKTKILRYCSYRKYEDGRVIFNTSSRPLDFKEIPGESFTAPLVEERVLPPPKEGGHTLEQKLNDLKDMKDKKVITDDEYSKMREKLLREY
jgi:hypothetical protein